MSNDAYDLDQVRFDTGQYLTFFLAQEMFAMGILTIKEIIQFSHITTVPLMPLSIRGVINLRGSVVPVIDLSARLGRGAATVGRRTCIVVIEIEYDDEHFDIGVMVDSVSAVIDLSEEQIEAAPHFGASVRTDFIAGMAKINGNFSIILDISHTFAVEELAQLRAE